MDKKRKPLRMCIVCRERFEKQDLLRLVVEDGFVKLDITGKINSRGAYICKGEGCIQKAQKNRIIQGKLGCKVPDDLWETIKN